MNTVMLLGPLLLVLQGVASAQRVPMSQDRAQHSEASQATSNVHITRSHFVARAGHIAETSGAEIKGEQAKTFQQISWQGASSYPAIGHKAMNQIATQTRAGEPKAGGTGAVGAADFPLPKYLGDPAKLGLGIQRTMALLATSTPQHRNTVKVLFYGQSITEGPWWKEVADDLHRRFPNANLQIENRALGGFSSQLLVRTAESDLYSF